MEPDPDELQHPGEEDLEWVNEQVKDEKPKGLYSRTSETARGLISTEKQCALFCGGKKCKYCSSSGEAWSQKEMVIKGLYSEWVTENILAMARPSNESIQKFDIVQQFLDVGINTIVNLQIAGEHSDCGPHKLDPSGFLYNPQTFMEKGVFFYNFGWPDYGVASLSTILDMVKVMQFSVSLGKVAVHCHAGRGRTGVIIACYLVFTNRITGAEAIQYVRDKRPNSIQTRQQMQVIEEFEKYLKPFRTVFASRQRGSHEFSLQQYLNRQRHILHGYEARRLKYVPKIIYVTCERLLELAKKGSSLQRQLNANIRPGLDKTFKTVSPSMETHSSTSSIPQSSSKDSLVRPKKRRYKASLASTRNKFKSISMEDLANDKFKGVLHAENTDSQSIGSGNSGKISKSQLESEEEDDNDSIVFGCSTVDLKAAAKSNGEGSSDSHNSANNDYNGKNGVCRDLDQESVKSEVANWSIDQSIAGQMSEESVQAVAYSLSTNETADYVQERAIDFETRLNQTDTAWTSLSTEGDPHVLAMVLWDWLDHLKEPILRAQDLQILEQWVEDPLTGLQKVEKGTRFTIEYLIKVVSKLKPLQEKTCVNIYEKLLSHLCHQWVFYDHTDCSESWAGSTKGSDIFGGDKDHWGEMRSSLAEKLFKLFHNIQHKLDASKSKQKLRS